MLPALPCLPHGMSQHTWKGHNQGVISLLFLKPRGMCKLLGKVINHSLRGAWGERETGGGAGRGEIRGGGRRRDPPWAGQRDWGFASTQIRVVMGKPRLASCCMSCRPTVWNPSQLLGWPDIQETLHFAWKIQTLTYNVTFFRRWQITYWVLKKKNKPLSYKCRW